MNTKQHSSPLYKLLRPSKPAPNIRISFADEHLRLRNTPTHSRLLPVQATKRPLSSPCYAYYCTVIDGERTHRIRQAYLQNKNCCLLVQNFIVFTTCQWLKRNRRKRPDQRPCLLSKVEFSTTCVQYYLDTVWTASSTRAAASGNEF